MEKTGTSSTDNIYSNQAGIAFRSAINNVWGGRTVNFPIIQDPNTSLGVQGDVLIPTFDTTEMNQMINNCRNAWNSWVGQVLLKVRR
jgi:hypothetical protein